MTQAPDSNIFVDATSKKQVATIAALASVAAAIVSGFVSYIVSSTTISLEQKRLESEDTLARAELFHNLVEKVQKGEEATYALLALWKIYPDDKRLIVITALQNPSVQKLTALRALGYAEELNDYEEAIKEIMTNATPEQREQYGRMFLAVSPEPVLDISVEAALRLPDRDSYMAPPILEVTRYVQMRPDLIDRLEERIAVDPRIHDDDWLRLALALSLYSSQAPGQFHLMLSEAEGEIGNFGSLAPLLSIEAVQMLTMADRGRVLALALDYLDHLYDNGPDAHYVNDASDLVERIRTNMPMSKSDEQRIAKLHSSLYRELAKNGDALKSLLVALSEIAPTEAQALYLETVACAAEPDAEFFFLSFDADILALENWDSGMDFGDARIKAMDELAGPYVACEEWS